MMMVSMDRPKGPEPRRRSPFSDMAKTSLAKSWAELETWYRSYMEDDASSIRMAIEMTIQRGLIIDEEEIRREVTSLVPGIETGIANGYCTACREFSDKWSKIAQGEKSFVAHLSSIQELEAASLAGCRLCRLFRHRLIPEDWRQLHFIEKSLKARGEATTLFFTAESNSHVSWGYRTSSGGSFVVDRLLVFQVSEPEAFSSSFRVSDYPIENPFVALGRAKQWIDACTQDHPLCKDTTSHRLPTRLLFIDNEKVKLVETANWETRHPYATLSHCWGELSFVQLTTKSLDSFKTNIPIHLLTKTFQNAIDVTRDLGLQYLWIDSLCIIQDSTKDWSIEAAFMSSVYGGSYINIAAAEAQNGSEGLFLKPPTIVDGALISPPSSNTPTYAIAHSGLYSKGISDTHLTTRAWILQERLLAPRTLHFGTRDLFWECRTKDACESFPEGLPSCFMQTSYHRSRHPLREIWQVIVKLYSSSNLTYGSDKLVALAGIARAAQNESGDEYIAGLWRTRMEELLCWMVHDTSKPWDELNTTRPWGEGYRAPSWSWASLDGSINYWKLDHLRDEEPELFSRVLDVCVSPSGPDPFGQLANGVLTLGCSGILSANLKDPDREYDDWENLKIFVAGKEIRMQGHRDYGHGNAAVQVVPIVGINHGIEKDRSNKSSDMILGLLLQPTGAKKGEFKRIGSFRLFKGTEKDFLTDEIVQYEKIIVEINLKRLKDFRAALEEFGPGIARGCCAETRLDPQSGQELFIITVI